MSSILDYCTLTPRPQQKDVLLDIEANWNKYDVFVIEAPVATGKSLMANTLASWSEQQAVVLTPNNILIDQYEHDYPDLAYLRSKFRYTCNTIENATCGRVKTSKKLKPHCNPQECCHNVALAAAINSQASCMNYHMYIAARTNYKYKPSVLIVDEAHNLLPVLQELGGGNIWQHQFKYPNSIVTDSDLLDWIMDNKLDKKHKLLKLVRDDLLLGNKTLQLERTIDTWRNRPEAVIKVRPLYVQEEAASLMWPGYVNKIILMSATINAKDVQELGLRNKRVRYIRTSSPISPALRPTQYAPVGSMARNHIAETLPLLAEVMEQAASSIPTTGVIHATYSVAEQLSGLVSHDRFMFHDRENKKEQYKKFRKLSEKGAAPILVASGLYEGVDLPNDLGRWQLITKVPYMSLADSAVYAKSKRDPKWYAWEAIKCMIQASGRISRHPKDYGHSIILDKSFASLYHSNRELFPDWFKASLIGIRLEN